MSSVKKPTVDAKQPEKGKQEKKQKSEKTVNSMF